MSYARIFYTYAILPQIFRLSRVDLRSARKWPHG